MKGISIAERILQYRQQNALTQAEFAEIMCVSPQAVSKWERVVCYPDITLLPLLAEVLGVSVNDFFAEVS